MAKKDSIKVNIEVLDSIFKIEFSPDLTCKDIIDNLVSEGLISDVDWRMCIVLDCKVIHILQNSDFVANLLTDTNMYLVLSAPCGVG